MGEQSKWTHLLGKGQVLVSRNDESRNGHCSDPTKTFQSKSTSRGLGSNEWIRIISPASNDTPLVSLTNIPDLFDRGQLVPSFMGKLSLFILKRSHSEQSSLVLFTSLFGIDGDARNSDADSNKRLERNGQFTEEWRFALKEKEPRDKDTCGEQSTLESSRDVGLKSPNKREHVSNG